MFIVYTNRPPNAFSVPGRYGDRVPMLVTGIGLAYPAFQPPEDCAAILQRQRSSRDQWDRDDRFWAGLDAKLAGIRIKGFALAEKEHLDAVYQSRIWAIAVPVLDGARARACLGALVLRANIPKQQALSPLLAPLQKPAVKLAALVAVN